MDSLTVVDRILKIATPKGELWHRYNHDGYGETAVGGPYIGFGVGRAWPVLTGERGHYELARGGNPTPHVRTLERVATSTGLLPEQVWDEADRPDLHLFFGLPTESATPLVWAHAEYVKLLRSIQDARPFDQVPDVAERYRLPRTPRRRLEVWKFNRRPRMVRPDSVLRVLANQPFRLRASNDGWNTYQDFDSIETTLGLHYFDLESLGRVGRQWTFTFFWPLADRWEGTDYEVVAGDLRPDLAT